MRSEKLLYTVSRWMVYELIHKRELTSVQIGRCRRVSARALAEYLARLEEAA